MKQLIQALHSIQTELPAVPKNGNGYNYSYQTFEDIVLAVRPLLLANDVVMVQQVTTPNNAGYIAVRTTLYHVSGELLTDVAEIPIPMMKGVNEAQQAGSAITYAKRYSIAALLGIIDQEDNDAATIPPALQEKDVIATTASADYFKAVAALLGMSEDEAKEKARALGYAVIPGPVTDRYSMYTKIKQTNGVTK